MSNTERSTALIVDDDEGLCRTLCLALSRLGFDGQYACSTKEAIALLETRAFNLVLLDFALEDGTAFDVLAVVEECSPLPAVVAMSGEVVPQDAFHLRDKGVRLFLPKPIDMESLAEKLAEVATMTPNIELLARESVGLTPFADAKESFTREMISEALAKAQSVRGAAKLLSISRQHLYYLMDTLDIERPPK